MVEPFGWTWAGRSVPFFLWQVVAITLEDFVVDVAKHYHIKEGRWAHVIGWLWTVAWFTWSVPIYIDWAFAAGFARHEMFSGSLVRPALDYMSAATGVDIVRYLTPSL